MFQFSGFASLSGYYVFNIVGCPIRISTDQFVCANPRSFSQLITSFFASESLGIPHTPLFCLLYYFCVYYYTQSVLSTLLLFSYLNMSMNFTDLRGLWPTHLLAPSLKMSTRHFLNASALWRISESNRWPPACKAGALASWANPPF